MRSLAAGAVGAALLQVPAAASDLVLARLDRYVDALREQAAIKGLAVAIVQNGNIAWERAYGWADVENSVAVRPDTPFLVAGLTQMLATSLVLRCAESGALTLDDPIASYTTAIAEPDATIRHVLTHMSSGQPGTVFAYDSSRFSALTPVLERCTGTGYRQTLHRELFERFGMVDSVPARAFADLGTDQASGIGEPTLTAWTDVLSRLAKPYKTERTGRTTPGTMPAAEADAATGVVSTVRDLATFVTAQELGAVVLPETLAASWSTQFLVDGRPTPSGIGCFVQIHDGERVVWGFGSIPDAYSSLLIQIPSRRVAVILLANTDGLASDLPLHEGDVRVSPFARLFLQLFL